MKKAIAFLLAFALIGGAVFAQDADLEARVGALEAKKDFAVTGSVEFGVAGNTDDPLWNLSSTSAATVSGTGSVAYSSDLVSAAVGFNLTPTITKTAGAAQYSSTNSSNYAALKKVVAYRKAAAVVYSFDALSAPVQTILDKYLSGTTWVKESALDKTSVTVWNEVNQLYLDVTAETIADIHGIMIAEGITPANVSTSDTKYPFIDQFDRLYYYNGTAWVPNTLTATQLAAAKKWITAWKGYVKHVIGVAGSDTWAASYPVTSASFKFNKLFGVADMTFHMKGKTVAVGDMVTSFNAGQDTTDETPLGLSLDLASGVVENLSAGVLFNTYKAVAAITETWESASVQADDAVAHVYGLAVNGGYALPGEDLTLSGNVKFGFKDLSAAATSYVAGVTVDFGMPNMFGLAVGGEFNYLAGNGMGAGVNVAADIMGIAPSVKFLYKNAAFGGDDSFTTDYFIKAATSDDIDDESGLQAMFDGIDSKDAAGLFLALSLDTEKLMGLKLATLSGGFDKLLVGGTEFGWNAALSFNLADVIAQPFTVGGAISEWNDMGMVYSASLGYTYDKVAITAKYSVTEVDDEHTYSVLAKLAF